MTQARLSGKVFLIGAGPGDPELLTLKAVRLIAQADVILVDDLVNRAILRHARAGVRVRYVGKRGGCRSTPQSFINRLMAHEASKGHQVVRLKGGDALIFGRANEEIDFLQARGVMVELVAGITSAQAAGMALMRSLTDRAHSHGVVFLTGHPRAKEHGSTSPASPIQTTNYAAMIEQGLTLVFYMGLARSPQIQSDLLAQGISPDFPAALVQRASCTDERVFRMTLGQISACVLEHDVQSPALLILGRVAGHSAFRSETDFATLSEIAGQHLGAEIPFDPRARSG
jgi:uroporphyrin-III C-methyltransferase